MPPQESVKVLLAKFDSRMQLPRISLLYQKVFDLRLIPLDDTAESQERLETWGHNEWKELQRTRFPLLDPDQLLIQSFRVYMFAKDNYTSFYDKDEAPPGTRETDHTPKPHLRLTGPGSVFEYLFERDIGSDITMFLEVADDMIAHRFHQCDTERGGSYMNLVKTKLRTGLGHGTYNDLVFLAFNLPFLHEIDYDVLVDAWIAAGRQLAVGKQKDGDRSKQVLRRLYKEDSGAKFLLRVESEFPPKTHEDFEWLRMLRLERLRREKAGAVDSSE